MLIFNILNIEYKEPMTTDDLTPIFKSLAHPTRLAILDLLRGEEQCVCHIEAVLGQRQAYISQHLMVLREAGLVADRRDGSRIYYRVVRPEVYQLLDSSAALLAQGERESYPARVENCPCPHCQVNPDEQISTSNNMKVSNA
jgi:ArsR family transcriptional regulator